MPSKPNYKHQRAERDRAKKASKEEKLQERKRKAIEMGVTEPGDGSVQDPAQDPAPVPGHGE